METKNKSFKFQTKTIFFPPLNKNVNVLMQKHDGPCMLIAIVNSLVLKGKISIDKGIHSLSTIINIIKTFNPEIYDLDKVIHGYYVNPSFNSCNDFVDYPDFLDKLNIKMVHSMVPSRKQKSILKNYNYDSMQLKLVELDSLKHCSRDLKVLRSWNTKINKQITSSGLKQISKQIKENEAQIYFRNSHFACIYKYKKHVYSLLTCSGPWGKNCVWRSLPSKYYDYKYYDMNFNATFCSYWEKSDQNLHRKTNSEMLISSKEQNADE